MMKSFKFLVLYIALIKIIILPVKIGFAMDLVGQLDSLQEQTSRQREQALRRQSVQVRAQQTRQLNSEIKAETDNAKTAASEAKIAEKEFKVDQKRVESLKNQKRYGKISGAVAPFNKSLSKEILEKSIDASGSYPAALRKAVESGDKAYDKHKKASEHKEKAAKLFDHTRALQNPSDYNEKLYLTGRAMRHKNESRRHLEKAVRINKQAFKFDEERKKLNKKLGSPPEYLLPTVQEKDFNDSPPAYKP